MTATVRLDPASVEAVAARVVDLLRGEDGAGELTDAAGIARRFHVSRDYVYAHSTDLGAVKLGNGPRARLRFDPTIVAERLAAPVPSPAKPRRRQRRKRGTEGLLPVRGGAARPVAEEVRP